MADPHGQFFVAELEGQAVAGDVWGVDSHGELSALALICQMKDGAETGALYAGYVDGAEGSLATVEVAGYEPKEGHNLWIFELQLGERA